MTWLNLYKRHQKQWQCGNYLAHLVCTQACRFAIVLHIIISESGNGLLPADIPSTYIPSLAATDDVSAIVDPKVGKQKGHPGPPVAAQGARRSLTMPTFMTSWEGAHPGVCLKSVRLFVCWLVCSICLVGWFKWCVGLHFVRSCRVVLLFALLCYIV